MRVLPTSAPAWTYEALGHLRAGGVVAFPTETVYGLGALLNRAAVEDIFRIKGRPGEKILPLQAYSLEQATDWGFEFAPGAMRMAQTFWPGPLTLLLRRPSRCPDWFAPDSPLIALRLPDHAVALELLRTAGEPLAVTSANLSGGAECLDADAVTRIFGDDGELLLLDGGRVPGGVASTVVDASGPTPVIVRLGPLSAAQILEVW